MSIYGYLRVSTEEQVSDGHSLASQRGQIERHAQAHSWTIDHLYVDEGVSSGKRRPQLEAALARVGRGDTLLVAHMDRMCRSVGELCLHLDQAQKDHWTLLLIAQPQLDMTTPHGRAFAQQMAIFAELERALIRQRTREGMRAAGEAGRIALVPDDVRARIAWLAADGGLSYRRIAGRLDEEGIRPPNGGERWSHSTVQRVLT